MKTKKYYYTFIFIIVSVACTSSDDTPTPGNDASTISQTETGRLDTTNESSAISGDTGAVEGATIAQAGSDSRQVDANHQISTGGGDASNTVFPQSGIDAGKPDRTDAGPERDGSPEQDAFLSDAGTSIPTLPPVTSVDTTGPFQTTQELNTGPSPTSGLFYPTDLGNDGFKHPVFVWGCGGMTNPSLYVDVLEQIASHGFIVIAEVSAIGDNGLPLTACIDWITNENNREQSVFYQKVDTEKVALGGHSIGSVNSFLVATDPRLTTTIHVAGGSLDDIYDPNAETTGKGGQGLVHPVAYISAEDDMYSNDEKLEKDYANTTVPAFMTTITGTEHIFITTDALPVMTGWLRWHLGGEDARRSMFLDPDGEFCTGKFVSKYKNW